MANYPDHICEIVAKFDLKKDELWQVHGSTWVIKHKAVERIGVQLGISWHAPHVIEGNTADKTVVVLVTGSIDSRIEWSFGEASPANNKNAYPWAMAEKRGKDRVVLKFLAAHGDVYSEEEADDFKKPAKPSLSVAPLDDYEAPGEPEVFPVAPDVDRKSAHAIKKERPNDWHEVVSKLRAATTPDELKKVAGSKYVEDMTRDWPVGFLDMLRDEYRACMSALVVGKIEVPAPVPAAAPRYRNANGAPVGKVRPDYFQTTEDDIEDYRKKADAAE